MKRFLISAAIVSAGFGLGGVAHAQNSAVEGRVDRLEREMRAVQRKVFPGGAGQTIEAQIVPEANSQVPGVPASSPVADLTQRVAALESQLSSITGQVEQGQNRLRQLEESFNAYKRATDARLTTLEAGTAPAAAVASGPVVASGDTRPGRASTPATDDPAPRPSGNRAQQVAAVERPDTGDAAEDGYTYGYRLWSAKLYPEARKELETVVAKFPEHRRASYSQNLLGRAYLDAGAPSLAAVAFYENYKKNPNGERAPDSLYYLAQALTKLKKPSSEICKVYTELDQLYGERLSAEMKTGVAEGRAAQKCQ